MPIRIAAFKKKRTKILFRSGMQTRANQNQPPSARLEELLDSNNRIVEMSDSDEQSGSSFEYIAEKEEELHKNGIASFQVPNLFSSLPPIIDKLKTESSDAQAETVEECLSFLTGIKNSRLCDRNGFGIPRLDREAHTAFLHSSLGKFPAPFVAMDASRPWLFYWSLMGLSILGEDVSNYRERLVYTLTPLQNPGGGFGGGHGQFSHCASTYAAILSLFVVGGEDALNLINRKELWQWLGNLKQRDGGFQLCVGGEEDVRGAYCSMVIVSLLNLPLELPPGSPARVTGDETFLTGLPEWIARCQTYEGGISGLPDAEAHGAYAFCALGTLSILGAPYDTIPKHLNLPLLLSWLSSRQHSPEGGFAGRTNKLVDGCYSHWVGGCWALVEAALNGPFAAESPNQPEIGSLWSREGLIRYILCCCQAKQGGLRDKPSKYPDAYHTCYNLAGLSSAQHRYIYRPLPTTSSTAPSLYTSAKEPTGDNIAIERALSAPYSWTYAADDSLINAMEEKEEEVFNDEDRVALIHTVFVLPWGVAERTRRYFEERGVF